MEGMWPISTHEESTALSFSNSTSLPLNTLLDSLVLVVIPLLTFSHTSSASSKTIISELRCGRPDALELELEFGRLELELELEFEVELELELEFALLELEELEMRADLPKGPSFGKRPPV